MSRANFIRTMILLAAAVSVSGCYYMPTNGPTSSDVVAGRGFAHGFVVLSETADFFYKCDDFYSPKDELSIRWNDPAIGIEWGVDKPQLSAKDADAPLLADASNLPSYGQI